MLVSRNLLPINRKHLGGLILLMAVAIVGVAFTITGEDDFAVARREILLRRVGHEVLLQSGDSTSRVLPVKKIAENEYQVGFEKAITFGAESMVNTTQRLLASDPLRTDYVVNVLNCADGSVSYGFAISKNKKDDIVACKGRRQPVACYLINIKFKPAKLMTTKNGYLLAGLAFLAFAGAILLRPVKQQKALPDTQGPGLPDAQPTGLFSLGAMSFDPEARKLTINGQTTDLTRTEARVLHIFAASPNEIIERSRLQKEIWEDEGVIVGRSLDMFISKLRKKLEADPDVRIVVIRGKGYKLQVGA